jgi:ribonuclease D
LHTIVTTPSALAEVAEHLRAHDSIALDTEFLRERTYRAELCLLQLSAGSDALCVDPLLLPDLTPLAGALTDPRIVKVMHASRQDLEVLLPAIGLVRPVFDTQIAAALAGMPAQIGYADLVRRLLGHELAKSHTRTDWSRRPLSPEQLEYALDDVRYLLPLRSQLQARLGQLGRLDWLTEELLELDEAASFTTDPEQAWLRIKGLQALDPGRTRLARLLAAWRERRAIERNRPRGWILDDPALREIVLRAPRSMQQLGAITEVPAGVVQRSGTAILECVQAAELPNPLPAVEPRPRPDPAKTALVRRLGQLNQAIAAEIGISPEVLSTRRDLEQLAEGRRDLAVLTGWRRAVIGERLLAQL